MKLGSLFSGIGLLDLGLERAGIKTVWQCEVDKHASKLLDKRFGVPNLGDITKVDWSEVERPDVLAGGFPCTPFSSAGLRKGSADERYLWPEYYRAIRELQPRIVIVENVAALMGSPEWGAVLGDLAEAGYDAKWACIRASDVGAPHRRERVFVAAYANSKERFLWEWYKCDPEPSNKTASGVKCERLEGEGSETHGQPESSVADWGSYEPAICRWGRITRPAPSPTDERGRLSVGFVEWMMGAPDGWTAGMSRTQALKGLGNGVVVHVAEEVGKWTLQGMEEQ